MTTTSLPITPRAWKHVDLGWNRLELSARDGTPLVLEVFDGGGFVHGHALVRLGPRRTLVAIIEAGEA